MKISELKKLLKLLKLLNKLENEPDFDEWFMGERMMFYKGTNGERLIRYYETQCKWKEIVGDSDE